MRRFIKLFILLSVLLVLISIYLIITLVINKPQPSNDDLAGEHINTTYTAAKIDIASMYAISYNISNVIYDFELSNDGTRWIWTENTMLPLDNSYFASMASNLENVTTDLKLKVTSAELENYGLNTPWLSITVSDNINGTQTFCFGSYNSFNDQYYFMSSATGDCVYMVDSSLPSAFNSTPYQMVKNDSIPTIDTTKVKNIKIHSSNNVTTYTYYAGGKDDDIETNDFWYVAAEDAGEIKVETNIADALDKIYETLALSEPIGYTDEERAEYGLNEPAKLEINYYEPKTITDSSTGASSTIMLNKSFSLLLGYCDEHGNIYVGLENSVLSYSIDGTALSQLYSAISKHS